MRLARFRSTRMDMPAQGRLPRRPITIRILARTALGLRTPSQASLTRPGPPRLLPHPLAVRQDPPPPRPSSTHLTRSPSTTPPS